MFQLKFVGGYFGILQLSRTIALTSDQEEDNGRNGTRNVGDANRLLVVMHRICGRLGESVEVSIPLHAKWRRYILYYFISLIKKICLYVNTNNEKYFFHFRRLPNSLLLFPVYVWGASVFPGVGIRSIC